MKRFLLIFSLLFALVAVSCDDDDNNNTNNNNNNNNTCNCGISIVSINDVPISDINFLTMSQDDINSEMPGFQVNVKVAIDPQAACVPPEGSQVTLMGGVKNITSSLSGNEIIFTDYTIPTGSGTLNLQASVPNCQSDTTNIQLTSEGIPECHIIGGIDVGQDYSCENDDDVPGQLGLQRLITVNCVDVNPGTVITFSVDGNVQTTAEVAANNKAEAVVTFPVNGICKSSVTVSISGEFSGTTLSDSKVSGESCCLGALPCALTWRENTEYVTGTPVGKDTLNMTTDADATELGHQSSFEITVNSGETQNVAIMADDGSGTYTEICSGDASSDTVTLNCTVPDGTVSIKPVCTTAGGESFEDSSQIHQVYVDTVPPVTSEDFACNVTNPHEVDIECSWTIPMAETEIIYDTNIKYTTSYDATECTTDEQGLFANSWSSLSEVPGSDTFDATGVAGDAFTHTYSPFIPGNGYCLGIRLVDAAGNISSNVTTYWSQVEPGTNLLTGLEDNAQFGNSVTSADLNCDGYKDLIVGAPAGSYEGSDFRTGNGKAYIYFALPSGGYSSTPDITITLDPAVYSGFDSWTYLGNSVAGIGNFTHHINASNDSDTCEDVAIAAQWMNLSDWSYYPGAVYILKGRPSWTTTTITTDETQEGGFDMVIRYERSDDNYADSWNFYEEFGAKVVPVGDFDNDSYGDIAIAAPGAMPSGAVYIVNSRSVPFKDGTNPPYTILAPEDMYFSLLGTSNINDTNDPQYEFLGWGLSALGDINNDGYDDMLVGAPGCGGQWGYDSQPGKAFIVMGGSGEVVDTATYSGTRIITITQDSSIEGTECFGWDVAGLGDFNNDGFLDFAISDKKYNRPSTNSKKEGAVFVFFGSADFTDATTLTTANAALKFRSEWDLSLTGQDDFFGMSVSPSVLTQNTDLGDFNNDGLPDLLIGSQRFGDYHGSIFIWYGNSSFVPNYDPNNWITYENATFWFTPPSMYGVWGSIVRWIGDINNDGYTDIAVGDPNWDSMYHSSSATNPNRGRVSVFY